MFGTAVSDSVSQLLAARGIELETSVYLREFEPEVLTLCPANDELQADSVVAMPLIEGPRIPGLPCDEAGFIAIDQHCRVEGVSDIYAAGDCTNFPIKQGGLGTQQADAAAEHIARRAGAPVEPQPFHPVLRGTLLTGAESLHMRHEVAGGGGEGAATADYLWWPPHKIASRYLAAWLDHAAPRPDPQPPGIPLDVEVAMPREWHRDPMALDLYAPLGVQWNPGTKTVE
jgi:sulfide:quinone oxidoreductase